jgi:LysM repeat protein
MPIGTKLTIPAPTAAATSAPGTMAATSTGGADSYTVKAGDNLTTIAKTHGTSISAIQALNNLKSTQIKAGQTLRMPPRASAAMNSTETPMTPAAPGNSSPVPSSTSLR